MDKEEDNSDYVVLSIVTVKHLLNITLVYLTFFSSFMFKGPSMLAAVLLHFFLFLAILIIYVYNYLYEIRNVFWASYVLEELVLTVFVYITIGLNYKLWPRYARIYEIQYNL